MTKQIEVVDNAEKRRQNHTIKAFVTVVVVLIIAILLDSVITYAVLRRTTRKTTENLHYQIEQIVSNNSQDEKIQLEEQKYTYATAVQVLAYILSDNPSLMSDRNELKELTKLIAVDEINVFDNKGAIVYSTEPSYIGLDMSEGEQIGFFSSMLTDKKLTLCQDVMPNTAKKKKMMYAATWMNDGNYIIQIGVEPKRLLKVLDNHDIEKVVAGMTLAEGYNIYAIDSDTNKIVGASDKSMIGQDFDKLYQGKCSKPNRLNKSFIFRYKGKAYFANIKRIENFIFVVSYDTSYGLVFFITPIVLIALYLFIAALVILGLFARLQATEDEAREEIQAEYNQIRELHESLKESNEAMLEQYDVLKSLAEIYYSVHLIDLEDDASVAFSQQGKVAEIASKPLVASEMMREIMGNVIVDAYKDKALEFTDLNSVAKRMKGSKMISEELLGVNIGWIQASFITVETDEDNYPTKVLFVTRWIDEEKKREENLKLTSNTDVLTGFYNRRSYEEAVKYYEDDENARGLVYVSVDVNGLKTVNDTYGHAKGDALLLGACDCLEKSLGPYGRIFRMGGDEFAALLELENESIDEILDSLNAETAAWNDDVIGELSIAVGYASIAEEDDLKIHDIAILADKRMYDAKALHYKLKGIERRSSN